MRASMVQEDIDATVALKLGKGRREINANARG